MYTVNIPTTKNTVFHGVPNPLHFWYSIATQNRKQSSQCNGLAALYLLPQIRFFDAYQNPLNMFAVHQVRVLVAKVQYMLSSQNSVRKELLTLKSCACVDFTIRTNLLNWCHLVSISKHTSSVERFSENLDDKVVTYLIFFV